jgi:predicted esterase
MSKHASKILNSLLIMEKYFSHQQKLRYYLSPQTNQNKQQKLLIALHGFGQLGQYFKRKFISLSEQYTILIPEGPHRYYLEGSSGRVGASWMTKEVREIDIENNLSWLQALLDSILQENTFDEVILLGFSQGAATAARWQQQNPGNFDALILWAGVFPPDITPLKFSYSKAKKVFVLGKQDVYFDAQKQLELIAQYQAMNFDIVHYEGEHDLDSRILKKRLS